MTERVMRNLENISISFRFITPILIAIVGYFTVQTLNSIDTKFEKIDIKFDSFLSSYHEVDKRIDRLEYEYNNKSWVDRKK